MDEQQESTFTVAAESYTVTLKREGNGYWTWGATKDGEPWASGTLAGPTDPAVAKARVEAEVWWRHQDEDTVEGITARVRRVIEDLERYAEHDEATARAEGERVLEGRATGYRNAADKLRREVLKEDDDEG